MYWKSINGNYKMSLEEILAIEARDVAVEAAYYLARQLKQSSINMKQRKDHFEDAARSKASTKARALAERIAGEIELREGTQIGNFSAERGHHYISLLFETIRALNRENLPGKEDLGKRVLAELRDDD